MLWKPLGSELGGLLPSVITPVTPAQATVPWVVWVEPIACSWLTKVHSWSAYLHSQRIHRGWSWVRTVPVCTVTPSRFCQCMTMLNALRCPGAGAERGLQLLRDAPEVECRLTRLKATGTFHAGLRRGLSYSPASVDPGRHFHAAGTTNGKYKTAGCSLCPRAQEDSHTSSCWSVGSQTVMEKSTARIVRDVTERISKGTRHLCLDSWIDAGTSTHQSHNHHLYFCTYCMFQSFFIAMCQSRALGDIFTQFGTAA